MRWFRIHTSLLHSAKYQRLPDSLKARLINLWCIAAENNGCLPELEELAFNLRLTDDETNETIEKLKVARFLEVLDGVLQPHEWAEHQYTGTPSTDRVRKHRARKKAEDSETDETVSETPETSAETVKRSQNRTEQKQIQKQNAHVLAHEARVCVEAEPQKDGVYPPVDDSPHDPAGGDGAATEWGLDSPANATPSDQRFDLFWQKYSVWRADAKKAARTAFKRAVKTEADFQTIMAAIEKQTPEMLARPADKRPHGSTWINGERWQDELPTPTVNGTLRELSMHEQDALVRDRKQRMGQQS